MPDSALDLRQDAARLTARLVDFPSESGNEKALADAVEETLSGLSHLSVTRHGNNVVARTSLGRPERVILAGHIDTVPIAGNVPSRLDEHGVLWGCGTSDMKAGVAVQLRIAATVPEPNRDLTFVFYDNEEVAAHLNGLGHVAEAHPDWLAGDFAVLLEPSHGQVEGGCQGTLRVHLRTGGVRAHSARGWMGANAIHAAEPLLARLAAYEPRRPVIDGLEYREGLNAVRIEGVSRATSSPTPAPSPSTTATRPTGARRRRSPMCARSSKGAAWRSWWSTTARPARCPAWRTRRPAPSWRRSAGSPSPSTAGPMCPGSALSVSRLSTTAQVIPISLISGMKEWKPDSFFGARNGSAAG